MAVTVKVYNYFKRAVMQGSYNLGAATIYCALLNNTYSPDIDADTYWGEINANEPAGTNLALPRSGAAVVPRAGFAGDRWLCSEPHAAAAGSALAPRCDRLRRHPDRPSAPAFPPPGH